MPETARRFRVLLVTDTYPPVLGGSEVEAQRVAAAMIRRGHSVRVVCSGGPPMPEVRNWVDPKGTPVSILTRHSRGVRKELLFAAQVAGIILAGRRDYDVVYFLMQGLHLAAGMLAADLAGVPCVVKIAGSTVIPRMRAARIGHLELDWMKRRKIKLMLLNPGMFEEAIADGFAPEQLVWMPNPVDLDEFCPTTEDAVVAWRREHGVPESAPVAIYVGRLSHEKGIPHLIGGFARAAVSHPDALLLLVGDGALREQLVAQASAAGVGQNQIRFVGRVEPGSVPEWLRASDVFALTSPSEGFACALLEAMSSGLPSVISDIPANLQLVDDGVQGLSVPFDDESRIADAFAAFFRDRGAARAMGAAARQRVLENYSTDRVVDRYEQLFASVVRADRN